MMAEGCRAEPVLSVELKTQVEVQWLHGQQADALSPKICGLFVPEGRKVRKLTLFFGSFFFLHP